jgi:hypothetical protein
VELVAVGAVVALLVWWSTLVWTGRARNWFYADAGWHNPYGAWVLWPGPIALVMIAFVSIPAVFAVEWLLSRWSMELPLGPAVTVAVGVPLLLVIFPRRWMFPPWVRARLTPLPDTSVDDDRRFVALHSRGCPYGGDAGSWLVAFDAVAGVVSLEGGTLRFEATRPAPELPTVEKHRHYSTTGLRPLLSRQVDLSDVTSVASVSMLPARRRPGALEVRTEGSGSLWLLVGDQAAAIRRIDAAARAADR